MVRCTETGQGGLRFNAGVTGFELDFHLLVLQFAWGFLVSLDPQQRTVSLPQCPGSNLRVEISNLPFIYHALLR